MTKFLLFLIITFCFSVVGGLILAQGPGVIWSDNVTLKCVTDHSRGGGGDVWGWKDTQTGKHYALVTLNGGLSISDVSNTSSPIEKVHINSSVQNEKLDVGDVETFESGGETYAYLSVYNSSKQYFVLIINLKQAITFTGFYGIDPENGSLGSVFVGRIQNPVSGTWQAHTLTISGGYLYVSTLKDKLPVWNLNLSPTIPPYLGTVTVNTPYREIHEM
jgi:hypothetical protein